MSFKTYRSVEYKREPRNKPTQLQSINLQQKRQKIYSGEETTTSANGTGKAGQLHINQ